MGLYGVKRVCPFLLPFLECDVTAALFTKCCLRQLPSTKWYAGNYFHSFFYCFISITLLSLCPSTNHLRKAVAHLFFFQFSMHNWIFGLKFRVSHSTKPISCQIPTSFLLIVTKHGPLEFDTAEFFIHVDRKTVKKGKRKAKFYNADLPFS